MIRISGAEYAALSAGVELRFVARLRQFLQRRYGKKRALADGSGLDELIYNSIDEARQAGLELEHDIALHVVAKGMIGSDYPDRHEGLFAVIASTSAPLDARQQVLHSQIELLVD